MPWSMIIAFKMAESCRQVCWVLFLLACIHRFDCVDRSNFKSCDQSGFCKRNREMQPNQSPYEFLINSLKIHPTYVEGEIINNKNNVHFKMFLYGIEDNTLRLKIEEANPLRPRFHPTIALINLPKEAKIEVKNRDANGFTVTLGDTKAILNAKPFRLDLYSGDELVMSSNARGLMRFEHSREKPVPKEADPSPVNEGEPMEGKQEEVVKQPTVDEDDLPDMWEETFKSHHDSKPHGPNSVGLDFSFIGFDNVYGIPEHADDFSLKQTKSTDPYRLYNLDVFEYEVRNPMALYGSIPYMIAHSESRTVGLLWMNSAEMWIDIVSGSEQNMMLSIVDFVKGQTRIPQMDTHWFAETGIIDFFFFMGPSHVDVSRQYATLTGSTQVPPLFSLGYHQCRWNYNDEEDVREVDAKLDEYDMPYDVIWLDIEHTDGKRYFTWDKTKFPDPKEMIMNLTAKGRKMVAIVDPHIKKASGYFVHDEATAKGYYCKNKDGSDYEGWCWPGSSGYLDFLNPEVRHYWGSNFGLDRFEGSTPSLHIWNDMNEPSVFNGPEVTMHKDAKHHGGWEHRDVHNIYGLLVIFSTHKGLLDRTKAKHRPFILSRSFFTSIQRYAAVWTGDNAGSWDHLKATIPMLLSLSVTGVSFSGADVGGYFGNPDEELQVRWYQAAAFQPFFRGHSHIETRRREPYLLNEQNRQLVREVLRKRYSYLPYWYTLFYENEKTGLPPMRPLWYEFPTDKATFKMEDQYMLGSGILVHPVLDQGATSVNVYLPGGNEVWYDSDTYEMFDKEGLVSVPAPINKIPVFLRGGTIIPKKERIRRASSLGMNDPYTLLVVLNKDKSKASGKLYIDDGYSYDYKQDHFILSNITFSDNVLKSRFIGGNKNKFSTPSWLERVIIIGLNRKPHSIIVESNSVGSRHVQFSMDDKHPVLTIRKPTVNMGEEWTMMLHDN